MRPVDWAIAVLMGAAFFGAACRLQKAAPFFQHPVPCVLAGYAGFVFGVIVTRKRN